MWKQRPDTDSAPPEAVQVDTSRRFVRVIETRSDGLVAFEFAIGWPELAVELLLPEHAFAEFCIVNKVERLPPRLDIPDPVTKETDE